MEAKQETCRTPAKMCQMAYPRLDSEDPEQQGCPHHQPGQRGGSHADGDHEKDQCRDLQSRQKGSESDQKRAHRTRGTHQIDTLGRRVGLDDPAGNGPGKVEQKIPQSAEHLLQHGSREPECDHVDDQMEEIPVKEGMGEKTPPASLTQSLPAEREQREE